MLIRFSKEEEDVELKALIREIFFHSCLIKEAGISKF